MPFINNGWTALLVEPQKICCHTLKEKFSSNPLVKILQCGCSDSAAELKLYSAKEGEGSEMATFSTSDDPWMEMVRNSENYDLVSVRTLTDIVDEYQDYKNLGILKIDTESFDYNVLKGLDFNICAPWVIVTEEYLWNVSDTISKHKYLESGGFVCLGWIEYNTIWVNRNKFDISWSLLSLSPWLLKMTPGLFPFNVLLSFHSIHSLLSRSSYYKGCLETLNLEIIAPKTYLDSTSSKVLKISVLNSGTTTLPCLPEPNTNSNICLSYHIFKNKKVILWDGDRTPFKEDLLPGQSNVLEISFTVPSDIERGEYLVEFDLVVDGYSWLSKHTGSPLCSIELVIV